MKKQTTILGTFGDGFERVVIDFLKSVQLRDPDALDIDTTDQPHELKLITEFDDAGNGEVTTTVTYVSYEAWTDQYVFSGDLSDLFLVLKNF